MVQATDCQAFYYLHIMLGPVTYTLSISYAELSFSDQVIAFLPFQLFLYLSYYNQSSKYIKMSIN